MKNKEEFYKKYRPRRFKDVLGNKEVCSTLTAWLKEGSAAVPSSILFSGPSGCGKTTLARILASKLNCRSYDFEEINAADKRGVDLVRSIIDRKGLKPRFGDIRIWLIDEAHQLTKDAQNMLLKPLEDTPEHVKFIICTTDPQKLIPTLLNRSHVLAVSPTGVDALCDHMNSILKKEKIKCVKESVVEAIAEAASGSPRKALVLLYQVSRIEKTKDQLKLVSKSDAAKQAIDLARAVMGTDKSRPDWKAAASYIKNIEEEPETVRRIILGYASSVLLGGGYLAPRAALVIDCFQDHFYDSGKAGLVLAAYNVFRSK